jgi:uracil-DNA glycosylase family 4
VAWREEVARVKRRAYREWTYWGRAVPGFGDARPGGLYILGLAPGAHGANRTGRMFTGDRSGDFLYAALHRHGLASQPTSASADDGLKLKRAFITNAARCVPPGNAPNPTELGRCAPFLDRELAALRPRAILALGAVAWSAAMSALGRDGHPIPKPRPPFAHGAELRTSGAPPLFGCYHVSQQNTQTGRLTAAMFDEVLTRALRGLASP